MKNHTPPDSGNYQPYFDAIRQSGFDYTAAEAKNIMDTPGIKPKKITKSSTLIKTITMTALSSLIITALIWMYPAKKPNGEMPVQKPQSSIQAMAFTPNTPLTKADTPYEVSRSLITGMPTPPQPSAMQGIGVPPVPPMPPMPPKFVIPDMKYWILCVSVLSGDFAPDKNPVPTAVPTLPAVKPMELDDKGYAQMGIHKTSTGIFIDLGSIKYCCNRLGTYIKPSLRGVMTMPPPNSKEVITAPVPTMITDEYGKNFRIYGYSESLMNTAKERMLAQGITSEHINEMATVQVLTASMNELVPILVANSADTSHGHMRNNIILWYDPSDTLFAHRYAAAKQGIDPNQGQTTISANTPETKADITPNDLAKTSNCTWGGFKVYPNPVNQQFNFDFTLSEDKKLKISLFDIGGRLVKVLHPEAAYTKGSYTHTYDIGAFTEGIYILAVQATDGETWTQRIIRK